MKDKVRKPTTTPGGEPPSAEGPELPERWSVQRKTEIVLRLLRGEVLDAVSRHENIGRHRSLLHRKVSTARIYTALGVFNDYRVQY